jgi:hypothetical protein
MRSGLYSKRTQSAELKNVVSPALEEAAIGKIPQQRGINAVVPGLVGQGKLDARIQGNVAAARQAV